MTSLSYEEIFSSFLGYVDDFDIAKLDISEAYQIMSEYLHKASAKTYLRRLYSSFVLDDEVMSLSYEMNTIVDADADLEFTKDILSKSMVVEWIQPQVKSKRNLAQFFGGKEQKWFSQSQHLSELRGLLEDTQLEIRKMIRDRGYIYNSYLENQ